MISHLFRGLGICLLIVCASSEVLFSDDVTASSNHYSETITARSDYNSETSSASSTTQVPATTQNVHPTQASDNAAILNMLINLDRKIDTLVKKTETELADVKHRIDTVGSMLDTVLLELSRNEVSYNSSDAVPKSVCVKGMPNSSPRLKIRLWDNIQALCDTETLGGGWIIIQRRTKGDANFTRNWEDYKKGFGTPDTDFWIGNDVIHNLTSLGYNELRIDLVYEEDHNYAHYLDFFVANESSKYKLTINGNTYTGTGLDNMADHNGMFFSTYDRDNDRSTKNCAASSLGGWWYNSCFDADLNGPWGNGTLWFAHNMYRVVTFSEIKVRQA